MPKPKKYIRAHFFGEPSSGKTWSAMHMAVAAKRLMPDVRIAIFDTEGVAADWHDALAELTGEEPVSCTGETPQDLLDFAEKIKKSGKEVCVVIDSLTDLAHYFRDKWAVEHANDDGLSDVPYAKTDAPVKALRRLLGFAQFHWIATLREKTEQDKSKAPRAAGEIEYAARIKTHCTRKRRTNERTASVDVHAGMSKGTKVFTDATVDDWVGVLREYLGMGGGQ